VCTKQHTLGRAKSGSLLTSALRDKNNPMIKSSTIEASVNITEDNYRYWLKRVWDTNKEIGVFIALNPSKATELKCDQTMCNINNLALQWGWGGFYILNLFAYMSTEKNKLQTVVNPIGSENDENIQNICQKQNTIVVSWGEEKPVLVKNRAKEVKDYLRSLNKDIYCLSKNKTSGYKHPCIINLSDYEKPTKTII